MKKKFKYSVIIEVNDPQSREDSYYEECMDAYVRHAVDEDWNSEETFPFRVEMCRTETNHFISSLEKIE